MPVTRRAPVAAANSRSGLRIAAMCIMTFLTAAARQIVAEDPRCPIATRTLTTGCEDLCPNERLCVWWPTTGNDTITRPPPSARTAIRKISAAGCRVDCVHSTVNAGRWVVPIPNDPTHDGGILALAPLALPPTTTALVLDGGSSSTPANVRFSDNGIVSPAGTPLQELVLKNVDLAKVELPVATASLGLRVLTIDSCPIQSLPRVAQVLPTLMTLNISKSRINAFPSKDLLLGLRSLRQLWLRDNRITNVTGVFGGIEELLLVNNSIETFSAAFPDLTVLELSKNLLTQLPRPVLEMKNLQKLVLDNNKLNPDDLSAMLPNQTTALSSLSLAKCSLRHHPVLHMFPNLTELDMSENQVTAVDASQIPQQMQSWNLSGNAIGNYTGSHPELRILDLSKNLLRQFPSAIWNHAKLEVLRIAGNDFNGSLHLSDGQFAFLQQLRQFDVEPTTFDDAQCLPELRRSVHNVSVCVWPEDRQAVGEDVPSKTAKPTGAPPDGPSKTEFALSAFVIGAAMAIFILVSAVSCKLRRACRRLSAHRAQTHVPFESPSTHKHDGVIVDADIHDLWIDNERVSYTQEIGQGTFGQVWLGTLDSTRRVAIKTVAPQTAQDATLISRFAQEAKMQAQLRHPRIVHVLGVTWTSVPSKMCVLQEFLPMRDLCGLLQSMQLPRGKWTAAKLQIAADILEALAFLHESSPHVSSHRDLKSRNVLLDDDLRAKVSDVGVAYSTMTEEDPSGPLLWWMAPEVLVGGRPQGPKADMYAFGIILCELDTHQMPYSDVHRPQEPDVDVFSPHRILHRVLTEHLRPTLLPSCPPLIKGLVQSCLSVDPQQRPTAMNAAMYIRGLQDLNATELVGNERETAGCVFV